MLFMVISLLKIKPLFCWKMFLKEYYNYGDVENE